MFANSGTMHLVPKKNIHGEDVCWFTDIPTGMCSHCKGLPWGPEVGDWDD